MWFWKRKQPCVLQKLSVRLAQELDGRSIAWRRKTASWLSARTERWTTRQKRICLILFCGISWALCVYILVDSLLRPRSKPVAGQFLPPHVPGHIGEAYTFPDSSSFIHR
jgi:hypothetical protein